MKRVLYCLLILLLVSCSKERHYFPDEVAPVDVQIVRFDSALLNVKSDADIINLYKCFPDFIEFYSEQILGIEPTDTAFMLEALPSFLADTVYHFADVNQRVLDTYSDISDIKKGINEAFGRLQYLYPDIELPEITFFVSGFNASLLFWNTAMDTIPRIAVSLDMYLGSDYEYYNRVVWNYQKQSMRRECIVGDIVSAYLFNMIPFTSRKSRLLDNMLYRGRVIYLLSVLMPEEPDYEIMGYTQEQWNWAKLNEKAIWQMMMNKQDLWKSESPVLTSYLNDGPFTAEISQEAPPRLGTFIGWQIAESYMNNNPDVSLKSFMVASDAEQILANSYYKP